MIAKIYIFLLSIIVAGCSDVADQPEPGDKAAITGFRNFVEAMTGRDAIDFNGYGNYCGLGGSGTPVDEVDMCCKIHDECYGNASKTACREEYEAYIYVAPYNYKADIGSIACTNGVDGIVSFGIFILATTGRNPLDFNGYGNFCGKGGSGEPVDEIDNCCKLHDDCYGEIAKTACKSFPESYIYVSRYNYRIDGGSISCTKGAIERVINVITSRNECDHEVCSCDAETARCFARYPYDERNKKNFVLAG